MDSDDPIARRQQRAHWSVRVLRGRDAAAEDSALLPDDASVEDRLAAVWELTVQAWGIAGLPIPDYQRSETPVRIRKRSEAKE